MLQKLSKPKSLQSTAKHGDSTANPDSDSPSVIETLFKTVKITGHNQNQENHNLNEKIQSTDAKAATRKPSSKR